MRSLSLDLPLHIFNANPPNGKRLLTASFEFADDLLTVVFAGNTYPFRNEFESAGITLASEEDSDDEPAMASGLGSDLQRK